MSHWTNAELLHVGLFIVGTMLGIAIGLWMAVQIDKAVQ